MKFQRSKYSRRIRKKKRVGEFRQYGFSIDIYCRPDTEGKIVDKIIDIIISKNI
ncbi:YggL family protein [Candidatus Woesearchaeota archaeon]|nr:YggL family protein [Candidatus Woesearchaeota archaeon]